MDALKCSVVVPTYNRPEKVTGLLKALREQVDPDVPFEVVLVDDGSIPQIEVIEEQPFPFSLVRLDENRGRASACNAGIAHAKGPLIVFMDDSLRPRPGHIRAFVERFDPSDDVVGIGPVRYDPSLSNDRFFEYQQRGRRRFNEMPADTPITYRYFSGGNSALPAELLKKVGGFEERLRVWGAEDTELAIRLEDAGARFIRVDGAAIIHTNRRDIETMYQVSRRFAAESLPLLFSLHPRFARDMHASVLGPKRFAEGVSLRRFTVRFATMPIIATPIRWLVTRLPKFPWPMRVFDYLIASAWRAGLDESEKVACRATTKEHIPPR